MSFSFLMSMRTLVIIALIISNLNLALLLEPAAAAFLPSEMMTDPGGIGADREALLQKVQSVLESKLVAQRLSDFGLTAAEIKTRLGQLSDQQLHEVATQLDAIQPGGDALGTVVVLLVIAILVVVLLQLTGHRIIITK
jgi:Family of unknown function (DUF6627)